MKKFLFGFLPGCIFAISAPVIFYVVNRDNRVFSSWVEVQGSVFLSLAFFGIFYSLAYLATQKADYAGLIATILVIGVFYLWQLSLAFASFILIHLVGFKIGRRKIELIFINFLLVALSLVVAVFYGAQLVSIVGRLPSTASRTLVQPVIASEIGDPLPAERPDVYYIILDGYGGADMLDGLYAYDNSSFVKALQDLGFVVPDPGRANYPYTVLSLGSSLNMQYLDTMASVMGDTPVWWPMEDALDHSQVRAFLEDKGYRTVFIASGFDYTDIRDGDEYVKPFPVMLNNFDAGFIRFTALSLLGDLGHLVSYPSYSTHRQIIQANFDALPRIALEPGPKFVFTHILAPHPPFVFDENGQPLNPDYPYTLSDKMRVIMDVPAYKRSYVSELQYVNHEMIQTITAILANSPTPPIIVIQGDHGPGLFLDTESAANTCLYERFSILNAYYLPGKQSTTVPATITPVNTFRLIFNEYFSTHFALLPDKTFFAPYSHFFSFQDVGAQIQPACRAQAQP